MGDDHTRWAAGILPVAMRGDTPVALLARDSPAKGGHWSDFAGGGEACDAGPEETALRELREESGGCVRMGREDLARALRRRDRTPRGKVLHRFIVKVPYDPGLPSRFTPNDEKTEMGWFPLRSLPRMRRAFAIQMALDNAAIVEHCRFF